MTNHSKIPAELRALPQWVVWNPNDRRTRDADGVDGCKVPLNPATLTNAKANDPTTWGTFEDAERVAREHGYGLGFEMTDNDPYICVDLDHVIENGEVNEQASEIVAALDTYTELSPSGTGLHLWCRAVKPGERSKGGGVEMYQSGRYIRMTGDVYDGRNAIRNAQKSVEALYCKYMGKDAREAENGPSSTSQDAQSVPDDVRTVMERAERSANGGRFSALMAGDTSAYGGDHSSADLALCSMAAFFSGGDFALTDAVFRQSGLMRPKWDEMRGERTYGQLTVEKALRQSSYYTGRGPRRPHTEAPEESTVGDQTDRPTTEYYQPLTGVATSLPDLTPVSDYMCDDMLGDVDVFSSYKPKSTGFAELDRRARGLYPGLYVLGALSSLGKTTFALNMADNLAASGVPVLFFSLEQSRFELVSKMLARRTYDPVSRTGVDALSIRSGKIDQRIVKAENELYSSAAPNITIAECSFDADVTDIQASVSRYVCETGRKPVVFLDYLQIMRPTDPRMSDKQAVDQNVHALKKLQADLDLTLIVISSVNRANYLTPMSFESFKESGGIEYTADVVWGLQFSCLREELFDKDKCLKEKRDRLNKARAESPRKIDLICLKNRYGEAFYTVSFEYVPAYDFYADV